MLKRVETCTKLDITRIRQESCLYTETAPTAYEFFYITATILPPEPELDERPNIGRNLQVVYNVAQ